MKGLLFGVLSVLAVCLPASAQDFRGGITGRIVDASGARLPGVFDGPVGRWGARRLPVLISG